MGDGFKVDTGSLVQAGRDFNSHRDDLSRALARLRASLPDPVSMCGDDEQGRKFASEYRPHADKLVQVLGDMVTGLGNVGAAFPVMADNFEAADGAQG